MVVRRKRKRRRGERSYHGSSKKWRGKGSRGGRGKAGLFDQKKTWVLKYEPERIGKKGFKRPLKVRKEEKTINLEELEELAKGKQEIDLKKLGFTKLLGKGKITFPLKVKVEKFSELAKKKIEAVGGKIES